MNYAKPSRQIFNCHNYISFEIEKVQTNWPTSCPTNQSARSKSSSAFLFCIEYIPSWSAGAGLLIDAVEKMEDQDED